MAINCNFNWNILDLFKDEILQCVFPRKRANQLRTELKQLNQDKEEICRKIQEKKVVTPGIKCKRIVITWLDEVKDLEENMLRNLDKSKYSGFSCTSRYKFGGIIEETLRRVEQLQKKGKELDEFGLFEPLQLALVGLSHSTEDIVGTDKKVDEMLGHLKSEQDRLIGIYGAGGIGKTTLMKELNNRALRYESSLHFELVIWVVVSQNVDINKIQEQMSQQIKDFDLQKDRSRADQLREILNGKKFLILLDDLWSRLDLTAVGIPLSKNIKGKVVFTTRSFEVCQDMNAHQKVKVDQLDKTNAMNLFRLNLGLHVDLLSNDAIRERADKVVQKCQGLPLALILTGKAFGCYGTNILEWDSGLESLNKSPTKITGMEAELLTILNFSFDRLGSRELQLCLLYCSLYPDDYNISTSFIIQQWVGEGILPKEDGEIEDYASLRKKGLLVISKLKSASLLESSELGDRFVKMHDSVREMCLWVTKGNGFSGLIYGTYRVYNTAKDSSRIDFTAWNKSPKISFIGSNMSRIDSPPEGKHVQRPKVMTMLLNYCYSLVTIPEDFFQFVPYLRVLDLTGAKLEKLPKSIFLLVELRFLNLKSTNIERLPDEFRKLHNLRQLYLENTSHLRLIPEEALVHLSHLQCLCLLQSSFQWGLEGEFSHDSNIQLGHLRRLKMLDEIGVDVKSVTAFNELLHYFPKDSASKLTALQFIGNEFRQEHASSAYSTFLKLRRFWIDDCNSVEHLVFSKGDDSCLEGEGDDSCLEGIYLNNVTKLKSITVKRDVRKQKVARPHLSPLPRLHTITVRGSKELQDLSCVLQIPTLERIRLSNCEDMRQIIPEFPSDKTTTTTRKTPFPNLQYMKLEKLPKFERISTEQALSFPSLRFLSVSQCPQLRRLPFDLESAKSIRQIRGSRGWWGKLQWDDDKTGPALSTYFQASS